MQEPTSVAPPLAARVTSVLEVPVHRFLGVELIDAARPDVGLVLRAAPQTLNNAGVVHGGVLSALLDVAAYLAVLPHLGANENAVTHDATTSIMRPVQEGAEVQMRGMVVRIGRSLVFARAEATVQGEVVAAGTVTKSRVEAAT